jgi:FtsH-binding integral membrane protein
MIMGLFGLIIASLINIFLKSSGLDWALSVIGVLIFAGLTAWGIPQKIELTWLEKPGLPRRFPHDHGILSACKPGMERRPHWIQVGETVGMVV